MSWVGDRWNEAKESVGGALSSAGGSVSNWWKDTGGRISGWWHSLPPEVRLAIVMAVVVALGMYAAIYFSIPFTFYGAISISGSTVAIPIFGISGGGATAIILGVSAVAGGAAGYTIGKNQSNHSDGSNIGLEKHGDSGHPAPQVTSDKGQGQQSGGGKSDEGGKQTRATPAASGSESRPRRSEARPGDKPGSTKQTPTQLVRRDDIDRSDAFTDDSHLDESAAQRDGFSPPTCVAADLLNQSAINAPTDIRYGNSAVESSASERMCVEDISRPYVPSSQSVPAEKTAAVDPEKSAAGGMATGYRVQMEKMPQGAVGQVDYGIRVTRDPLWRPPARADHDRFEKGGGGRVGPNPEPSANRAGSVASPFGSIQSLTFELQREELLRSSLARMSYVFQVKSIPGQIEAKYGQVGLQPMGVARKAAEEAIALRRSVMAGTRSELPAYVSSLSAAEKMGRGIGDALGYRNVEDALRAKGVRAEAATSETYSGIVKSAGTPARGWNSLGLLGTAVTLGTYAMDIIRWKQELENGYMDIPTLGGSIRLIFDEERAYKSMEGQSFRDGSGLQGRVIGGVFVADPL